MNRVITWQIPVVAAMVLLGVHAVLWRLGLYSVIPFVDVPLHFGGGFIVAVGVLAAAPLLRSSQSRIEFAILILSVATTFGVLWEFFELGLDLLLGTGFQNSIVDTLKDILLAMIGAGVVITWNMGARTSPSTHTTEAAQNSAPVDGHG